MAALAPRQIMNEWSTEPREILETFAAEMRANQRHYSIYSGNYAIVIPKQLREPPAGPSAISPSSCMSVRECAGANGPMSERARWCATVVKPYTRRWSRPIIFWSWPPGGPAGGFGAVIPPWFGNKTKAVTAAIGACVDCEQS
jgi:hypothetical protein